MFCLQLSACPSYALKARQSQITVLRHHFRKGHRPCVLKIAVAYFQIQHHIVISGFLVLFQNGSHLILNGSQFLHTYLRIWKGDSQKGCPQTLYFFFRLRIFSQIAPPTMNITSTMAITVFASIP